MGFAPILSLCLTFWFYTNKQMFGNKIDVIDTDSQIVMSHHFVEAISLNSYGLNLFDILVLLLAIVILIWLKVKEIYEDNKDELRNDIKNKLGSLIKKKVKKYPKYIESLKDQDIAEVIDDEGNFNRKGFQILSDDIFEVG